MARATGTLYVVATPIGNLEDLSFRALRVLREADYVYAEDTRETRNLLGHYGVRRRLRTYLGGEERKIGEMMALLDEGRSVAIVSDRGMPGVSDPGERIVRAAIDRGHEVVVVPGATAAIAALALSGLPTDRFVVEGFLPKKGRERARRLAELRDERRTVVIYESPTRLARLLEDLARELGSEREAAVARELTKVHEEVRRGTIASLLESFAERPAQGECVVVVAGAGEEASARPGDEGALIRALLDAGMSVSEVARVAATVTGRPRRSMYEVALALARAGGKSPES